MSVKEEPDCGCHVKETFVTRGADLSTDSKQGGF